MAKSEAVSSGQVQLYALASVKRWFADLPLAGMTDSFDSCYRVLAAQTNPLKPGLPALIDHQCDQPASVLYLLIETTSKVVAFVGHELKMLL